MKYALTGTFRSMQHKHMAVVSNVYYIPLYSILDQLVWI